jgi:DNA-binding TFAR19-related protein (PDSD5 family)
MVVNIIERNNKTQKEMDAAVNNQIYVKDQKRNSLQSLLRSKKEKMQNDRIMHVDTADKVEKKVISLWGKPIPQKDVYSQKDAENLARIISYIIRNEFKN